MKTTPLLLLTLLLYGCETTQPQMVWFRANTTEAQFRQDFAEAQVKLAQFRARRPANPYNYYNDQRDAGQALYDGFSSLGDSIAQGRAEGDYFRACMESKGYVLRPKLLVGDSDRADNSKPDQRVSTATNSANAQKRRQTNTPDGQRVMTHAEVFGAAESTIPPASTTNRETADSLLDDRIRQTDGQIVENKTNLTAQQIAELKTKAEKGDAHAQFSLGEIYASGEGVPKDAAEAAKWYRKAADQGDATMQAAVAGLFYYGQGVEQDYAEAARWSRKAADQGLAEAQGILGIMYDIGEGLSKDDAEAARWFRKAAEQGLPMAQYLLGEAYGFGKGVSTDDKEAAKWYRRAAEQGLAQAQAALGALYCMGAGVPKNAVEGYKWLNLAAANGLQEAAKFRTVAEREMTPYQIAEAQRLAREFVPRKEATAKPGDIFDRIAEPEHPRATGTAFFISEDGYLITNEHVTEKHSSLKVRTAKGELPAELVRSDPANDLALLKVTGRSTALPIKPSRTVRLGETVATLGFPNPGLQGFSPKLTKGEISSLAGIQDDPKHFQISLPVQPGNSGGALVDASGNVVGVVVAKLSQRAALATTGTLAENVNYAVKSSFLLSFLESVPGLAEKLKEPRTDKRPFEEVVAEVEQATALVLVY